MSAKGRLLRIAEVSETDATNLLWDKDSCRFTRRSGGNAKLRRSKLFLYHPIKPDRYDLTFLVGLLYRDDSLVVDRVKNAANSSSDTQFAAYDHVFDYRGDRFVERKRPWPPELAHGLRWAVGR